MSKIKKKIYKKCIIKNYVVDSNLFPEEKFVDFPRYGTDKFYKWIDLINQNDMGRGIFYICRKHFTADCFADLGMRISKNANPSLHINKNEISYSNVKTYCSRKAKINFSEHNEESVDENIIVALPSTSNILDSPENIIVESINENLKSVEPFSFCSSIKKYDGPKIFEKTLDDEYLSQINEFDLLKSPNKSQKIRSNSEICVNCKNCLKNTKLLHYYKKKWIAKSRYFKEKISWQEKINN